MHQLKEIREKALVNVKEVVEHNEEKVKEAYEYVMRLLYKAQKEGLLELAYEAEFLPKELPFCNYITEILELICDGTDPDYVSELMTVRFMANNYTGIDALLYFLYSRGLLMLQAGVNPIQVEDFFHAAVSGTGLVFQKRRRIWDENYKYKVENWKSVLTDTEKKLLCDISQQLKDLSEEHLEKIVNYKYFYAFDKVLPYLDETVQSLAKNYMNEYRYYMIMSDPDIVQEQELSEMAKELRTRILDLQNESCENAKKKSILDELVNCSDKEISLLIKNVDMSTLTVALNGVNEEVKKHFLRNMPLRSQYIIQENMQYMGPLRLCDVEDAQKKILQIAKERLH